MFGKSNKWGKHTKESKQLMSNKQKGSKNSMFGKKCPVFKRSKYRNIYMRSSWEIAYAKYLDKNNIKWQYEPKRFYFKNCSYLPDFYLPKTNEYIEIKGWWRKEDKKRFKLFKKKYSKVKIKVLMQKQLNELSIL